jgi:hypothetical protein
MLILTQPLPVVRRRQPLRVRASADPVELAGKFLGLFVLFTSSMNWWFYKRTREKNNDK